MALPVIAVSDFTGWVKLSTNQFTAEKLEEYITLFREEYLRRIVGDGAYADIEAQARQKWTDLLQGTAYVDVQGDRRYLPSMVRALAYFIYFEFVRDNFTSSQVGKVKGKSANSERASDIEVLEVARSRYNQAVRWINRGLPGFLEANKEFSEDVTAYVDNADGTYTLSIPSTKYLEDGDTAVVIGLDYEVSGVVANVSIVIDAGVAGFDFTGAVVTWEPYKDIDFCTLEVCGL